MRNPQTFNFKVLSVTLLLTTVSITPWFSYDSINLPKFTALVVGGSFLLFGLIDYKRMVIFKKLRVIILSVLFFLFWSIITYLKSDMNKLEGFYGVDGRRTGLVTYLFLSVIFLSALFISGEKQNKTYFKILLISGTLSAVYALIQILKLDPFLWNTQYKPIFGFFGNSNFLSSFLGISSCAIMSPALIGNFSRSMKYFLRSYLAIVLCIIYYTESEQGFFVFLTGLTITSFAIIKNSDRYKKYSSTFLFSTVIAIFIVLMDIFQKTPWKSFLYSPSISERGEFWRAAIKLTTDNPFFGVGLDGFQDSYHRYRESGAAIRDPNAQVNSVHNVILDFSVGGGIPLALCYVFICGLVIRSGIKVLRKSTSNDVYFISIFSAWVGYQVQSIISINQIGIAIWGWILGGAIIGYEKTYDNNFLTLPTSRVKKKTIRNIFALCLGLALAIPQIIVDTNFRSQIRTGDGNLLLESIDNFPTSIDRINIIGSLFLENNLPIQALVVSKYGIENYPSNLQAWKIYYGNPNLSTLERKKAEAKIRILDPLNKKF